MQQLSGMDTTFLALDSPRTPMHIGSLLIYEQSTAPGGRVTFKQILSHFASRLQFARCFRQRLVYPPLGLDRPWWIEDPDFDLEFHLRHIALPHPGDWRQLCIQTARLMSRPLDMNRPLWEITVIEGLDRVEGLPPGCFALMTKIHHAAIDGVSGAEIFAATHDLEPGVHREGDDTWQPEPLPNPVELLGRAAMHGVTRPVEAVSALSTLAPALGKAATAVRRHELDLPPLRVPRTRFNNTITAHRVFDGRRVPLEGLKSIRAAVPRAKVNDAVLAVVGGAMRRYLDAKGELPDESLVAMAPVSVRGEERLGQAGNEISAMLVRLHTEIPDPLERLAAITGETRSSKQFDKAIGAALLTDFAKFGPLRLAALAARLYTQAALGDRASLPMSCVVTNVPGPPIPLWLDHSRVLALYGLGPVIDGMALIHPVFSYRESVTISFTSCREILPDPAFYADCIQASYDELVAAAHSVGTV